MPKAFQANFVRPDFSQYVVHFTKDGKPLSNGDETNGELKKIAGMSAYERLISILSSRQIRATRMPWTNKPAICFTECTWASLLDHAQRYSRFGMGFTKAYLFSRGGGPAIYLTPGLLEHQKKHVGRDKLPFDPTLYAFMTPFVPPYAPPEYRRKFWNGKKAIDYSHEREWRVPHDLDFGYSDVAFIIVASYNDMAKAPKELKDAIGRENWLIMDNYARIEGLWPVHKLPEDKK
jgi:hypothetical protein